MHVLPRTKQIAFMVAQPEIQIDPNWLIEDGVNGDQNDIKDGEDTSFGGEDKVEIVKDKVDVCGDDTAAEKNADV